jgi:hypoxanthine-guanine phosphoribosyltransferase
MKTCVKAELQVPSESLLAWIRERFPELPDDAQIQSVWASSYGSPPKTVKIVIEHTHVDSNKEVVVVDDMVDEAAPVENPTDGT